MECNKEIDRFRLVRSGNEKLSNRRHRSNREDVNCDHPYSVRVRGRGNESYHMGNGWTVMLLSLVGISGIESSISKTGLKIIKIQNNIKNYFSSHLFHFKILMILIL